MVTKEQAMNADWRSEFHCGECKRVKGPRGGVKTTQETWRVNGACKTWKTRPTHFSLPVKYGLRGFHYIDHHNADQFHSSAECPLNHAEET